MNARLVKTRLGLIDVKFNVNIREQMTMIFANVKVH
jgi:hypothetical protein